MDSSITIFSFKVVMRNMTKQDILTLAFIVISAVLIVGWLATIIKGP